ncbi:MAG: hypothetical protein ABI992_13125 [Chthoniobacterales bacterium]
MKSIAVFILALVVSLGLVAGAGLPPWQIGMTAAQVAGLKNFGPYKSFSNGDLETFNGRLHGRKQNVQFYFQNGRLRRIAVNLGEGTDRKKAVAACEQLYELLQRDYGGVTISEDKSPRSAKAAAPGVQAIAATMNADVTGITHLIPARQPAGMRVVGLVRSGMVGGQKWFYVTLNFDERA